MKIRCVCTSGMLNSIMENDPLGKKRSGMLSAILKEACSWEGNIIR